MSFILHAAWHAVTDILKASLALVPWPIAMGFYSSVILKVRKERNQWPPSRRRFVADALVAFLVASFVAYGFGQNCPTDDTGVCDDDDWKAPSPY